MISKPTLRPTNSNFSSGPCAKRPGWSTAVLEHACVGRSHRSTDGKDRIRRLLELSRSLLEIPDDYLIGLVPGSDTGAVEMALWSMLGQRGVDMLAWESFGNAWVVDVLDHLKLEDVRVHSATYGALPDLGVVDFSRDVVFAWNGTTSGVCVPDGNWIDDKRSGLTICDATSAVFAVDIPWRKLDVTTFSWQKSLGGEAAHGMLILGPRAVERLESYQPTRPLPKIFRITKAGKLNHEIFLGATINTPSMLCIEDALDSLAWAQSIGGLRALIDRSKSNCAAVADWVKKTAWIEFLASEASFRSPTSVCLRIIDDWFVSFSNSHQRSLILEIVERIEAEEVAYDINAYRDAPPGFRIWCGPTVERADIEVLTLWLDWSYLELKSREQGI